MIKKFNEDWGALEPQDYPKFKVGDRVINYNCRLGKGVVVDYVQFRKSSNESEPYRVQFDSGILFWMREKDLVLNLDNDNDDNDNNSDKINVIGLPSGQILYMKDNQIKWLKARNYIVFRKVWTSPEGERINISGYSFEDFDIDTIKDLLDTIAW